MEILRIIVDYIELLLSILGVIFVTWGAIYVAINVVLKEFSTKTEPEVIESEYRQEFASKLVLGLEFFIAVDIIKSVYAPTFESLGILAALVAIRTLLSYSLNQEISEDEKLLGIFKKSKIPKKNRKRDKQS